MRAAKPNGEPAVIELAGLPGAGKTSISNAVLAGHFRAGGVGILDTRLGWPTIPFASVILRLALSARPFSIKRIGRAFELIVFLRHYTRHASSPILMDQGLTQKLWSMLIETSEFSLPLLEEAVKRLAPYAPDHLVWVETPAAIAAERIADRTDGNSRFDDRPREEIAARLDGLTGLYRTIVGLFERHTQMRVLTLRGEDPIAENAAQIGALLERRH